MSENYYAFKAPVTSVQAVQIHQGRTDVNIWIRGQMAGHIICKPDEVDEIFNMFVDGDDPVVHIWFDGIDWGMGIKIIRHTDGYITNGRRVTTVQNLQEIVEASRKAHAEMRERKLNIQESEGGTPNA